MADPTLLQYLKSIDDRTQRMESRMVENLGLHQERIRSLEDTRSSQRGIMIGGGMAVTFFSGLVTWLVDHVFRGGQ